MFTNTAIRRLFSYRKPALHGDKEKSRWPRILESHGYGIFLLDGTPRDDGALRSDEEIYAVSRSAFPDIYEIPCSTGVDL